MGQLDVPVQTAPADLGILTPAVWSLVACCSHMTLQQGKPVCVRVCEDLLVDVRDISSNNLQSDKFYRLQ